MRLQELMTSYVTFKKALGLTFTSQEGILRSFCRAMGDIRVNDIDPVSVEAFLASNGRVTTYWYLKFKILSGFFRFLSARGYADTSPLPVTIPNIPERRPPHIYTLDELRRLLAATEKLYHSASPLQPATYRTLLLILYGTGMRISEALGLRIPDVELSDCLITVREGKFSKTRFVPMGPRLTNYLQVYAVQRQKLHLPEGSDSAFFSNGTGGFISYQRAKQVFARLRKLAGISPDKDYNRCPRIHDLRHTFAVHRLLAWYRDGADVQCLLPRLSTYLGHVDISATQVYLSMIPELLQEASQRFEHYTQQLEDIHD